MDWSAPHVGFVLACYGVSLLVIVGLAAGVVWRDRKLKAELRRRESAP